MLAFSGLAASGQHYLPQLPNFPRLISHWEVVTSPGQHDGRLGRRWLVALFSLLGGLVMHGLDVLKLLAEWFYATSNINVYMQVCCR